MIIIVILGLLSIFIVGVLSLYILNEWLRNRKK